MISQARQAGDAAPPVTGPGQVAVFTYRDQRGEEAMLTVDSGPGLPPVEFQGMNELRRIGIPLESVTAVHTDLRPSMLPGGYTALTAREAFT
ncbi:MAG: nucleic acid/nucleotide deaminase domain-containing protein, partial [Micromonosporaceae bacterium]